MGALRELDGTRWVGKKELWFDPDGDARVSEAALEIDGERVSYSWTFEGKGQQGAYRLSASGAEWTDSWHQSKPMACESVPGLGAVFSVLGAYAAPPGADWGWRSTLSLRPTGELVLQMTNICPWGEEQRAVRMTLTRTEDVT